MHLNAAAVLTNELVRYAETQFEWDSSSRSSNWTFRPLVQAVDTPAPESDREFWGNGCLMSGSDSVLSYNLSRAGTGHNKPYTGIAATGRYDGTEAVEDDDEPFEQKMKRLMADLRIQMAKSKKLDEEIWKNLGRLGFGD